KNLRICNFKLFLGFANIGDLIYGRNVTQKIFSNFFSTNHSK
ncbi:unnamed protein product, partial [Musa hybrid cultivar]